MCHKVLIGADGVHSQVRNSIIRNSEMKILPFVVFNGRRRIKYAEYKDKVEPTMNKILTAQYCVEDVMLTISVNQFAPRHVDLSYTYSRPVRQNDLLHRPDRPMTRATIIPNGFFTELGELERLPKPFDVILDPSNVKLDKIYHWLMRSSLCTPEQLKGPVSHGILLIGDASHSMPILGGEGANAAITDGIELAKHISLHGTGTLQDFSDLRFDAWQKGVQESEEWLANMHIAPQALSRSAETGPL